MLANTSIFAIYRIFLLLEKLKIEFEAQTILLKHEITNKTEQLDRLLKETETQKEIIKQLQQQLKQETQEVRRRCI